MSSGPPVVAVVPAKLSSTRAPNKNTRHFAGQLSLLELKLRVLTQCRSLARIVVDSDNPTVLALVERVPRGPVPICTHLRPSSIHPDCSGSELFAYLASIVDEPHVMYTTCVTPFVSKDTYERCIAQYCSALSAHDSLVSTRRFQEFFWDEHGSKAINYDPRDAPRSQDLPAWQHLTFGICIIRKDVMLLRRSVVGETPQFVQLSELESVDIDTKYDFLVARLLWQAGVRSDPGLDSVFYRGPLLSHAFVQKPLLLDCTLRDGGYTNDWQFSPEFADGCLAAVREAGFEFFEYGFLRDGKSIPYESSMAGAAPQLCVMVKHGELDVESGLPAAGESRFSTVRMLLPFGVGDLSVFAAGCRTITDRGYSLVVNLACAGKYDSDELQRVVDAVATANPSALVLADTFGDMTEVDASRAVSLLQEVLIASSMRGCMIGFHAHNNCQDGMAKAIAAVNAGAGVVDGCIGGLGRGAGNVPSELLAKRFGANPHPLFEFAVKHVHNRFDAFCGPSPLLALAAHLGLHPTFATEVERRCPSDWKAEVLRYIAERVPAEKQHAFDGDLLEAALRDVCE